MQLNATLVLPRGPAPEADGLLRWLWHAFLAIRIRFTRTRRLLRLTVPEDASIRQEKDQLAGAGQALHRVLIDVWRLRLLADAFEEMRSARRSWPGRARPPWRLTRH